MTAPAFEIRLTGKEAEALLVAVGNTLDYPDVESSVLPDRAERDAARRAVRKVEQVVREASERASR